MNLDDFSYEQDNRRYINPQTSLDEQNAFIQNLRNTQQTRNAEIAQDTHNLGTDVPSNLGGLTGAGSYFNTRYQTPQTNAAVADLRAAAQAQALNTAMSNELAQAKKRYDDAYKAAQKRSGSTPATNSGDDEADYENSGDAGYALRYLKTDDGTLDSGATNTQKLLYQILTSDGKRIPVNAIGIGNGVVLETPTQSYIGKDAVTKYMDEAIRNGGQLIKVDPNTGKTIDNATWKYRDSWGI